MYIPNILRINRYNHNNKVMQFTKYLFDYKVILHGLESSSFLMQLSELPLICTFTPTV